MVIKTTFLKLQLVTMSFSFGCMIASVTPEMVVEKKNSDKRVVYDVGGIKLLQFENGSCRYALIAELCALSERSSTPDCST